MDVLNDILSISGTLHPKWVFSGYQHGTKFESNAKIKIKAQLFSHQGFVRQINKKLSKAKNIF